VKPFIAVIGPPRIVAGLLALGFGVVNIAFDTLLQGKFDASRHGEAYLAFVFGIFNLGQEGIKAYLRSRFTIVEMDEEGIFDRRIMKAKLGWQDIDWIDPHPAGLPDRLRVMGKVELTAFGKLRNFLIRIIRRVPRGETLITFGGLNKAGAQATSWIADNKSGFVPDIWKSVPKATGLKHETQHRELLISAAVFWREWIGTIIGGVMLVGLVGAISPAIMRTIPIFEKVSRLPALVLVVGALVLTSAVWLGLVGTAFWIHKREGDTLIMISQAGISDARVSGQFIDWSQVESVTFAYRDMGRLIDEILPVTVQLREGTRLTMPNSKFFWPLEWLRRATTPELITLRHSGTTTSVSEIIETIQREEVPVAIREIARG
jgi:hypothetical protein